MKLSVTLDQENERRFQEIKEHSCLQSNRSVVELLIYKEYDRIQESKTHKLFLSKEVYEKAKTHAQEQGKTIEEYVNNLISEHAGYLEDAAEKLR
jgi:hypothetical protein